jgi:hypothetical protein
MAGMLDYLYGGPSTQLNPVLDDRALGQFAQDQGYGQAPGPGMLGRMFTMPGWANQALRDYAGPEITGKTLRRAVTPPGWLSNMTMPDLRLNPPDPNQMGAAVPSATSGLGRGAPTGPGVPVVRPLVREPLPPGTPGAGQGETVMTPPPPAAVPGDAGQFAMDQGANPALVPGTPAPALPPATGLPPAAPVGGVPKQDNFPGPAAGNAPRPSPVTSLPQASAGVLDRINDYLRRNSNLLIGMGAGFAGAPSFGQGVSRAGYGALAGSKLDVTDQQREATVRALMGQGYSRDQAEAIAGESGLLKTQDLAVGPPGAEQKLPIAVSPFGVRPLPINLGQQGAGGVGPGTQIVIPEGPNKGQVWRLGPNGKWEKMVPGTTGT